MKLVKYDSNLSDPFAELEEWLDGAFYGANRPALFNRFASIAGKSTIPVNIFEDEANYYVTAELPGFERKEVSVELENAVLSIVALKKGKKDQPEITRSRVVTVGDHVDSGKVKARLENGVLTITLPRLEEKKPKTISVR